MRNASTHSIRPRPGWLAGLLLAALTGCGGGAAPVHVMQTPDTTALASHAQALALLATEPTPAGVDDGVFQQLKDELERTLRALHGSHADPFARQASSPGGPADAAVLELDNAGESLSWYLDNPGDYDQNGIVGISDLTPLGIHFGLRITPAAGNAPFILLGEDQTTPFAYEKSESVVDGDGNGEIGIADVTTIGQNFGRQLLGYRVYAASAGLDYPGTPAAASTLEPLAELLLSDAQGSKAAERLHFSYSIPAEAQGLGYWVRPLFASGEGSPSRVQGQPLAYPADSLALLEASPGSAEPGTVATLRFNQPIAHLSQQLSLRPLWADGVEFPLAETALARDDCAYMRVPLLLPGTYQYSVLLSGTEIGSFSLEVLQAETSQSPAGLLALHELSLEGVKLIADPTQAELLGMYPEQFDYPALRSELDKFDELFGVLFTWIDSELQALSPAEQQQVLAYLDNTGYTGLIDSLSVPSMQASRARASVSWTVGPTPWDNSSNFERLYYDAWSSQVTNSGFLFDLAGISLSILNANLGFSFSACTLVLGVQKHIIDLCFPTDLAALELAMPRQRLVVGEPYLLDAWGQFYSEREPSAGQILEALISSLVSAMPLPQTVKSAMLASFTDYAILTGANLGITLALDEVLPTAQDPGAPWDGHVDGGWVRLDPFLYENDDPQAIYRKLGMNGTGVTLSQSQSTYRNQQYPSQFPLRPRQDPGDFIGSGGGSYKYMLEEAGQARISFPAVGQSTLFLRGFAFQSESSLGLWSHSYPESVSRRADLWIGRDSDWQLHEILSEASLAETAGGTLQAAGQLLEAEEYPLVLAQIDGGTLNGPCFISAKFQSGASWDDPLAIASGSILAAGKFQGRPAAIGSQNLLIANNAAGTSWPAFGDSLPGAGGQVSCAELFSYQSGAQNPLRPAVLRSAPTGRVSVSLKDEIGTGWALVSDQDLLTASGMLSAMVDGRPAVVWDELYYIGEHPNRTLTRVDVLYAIADDSLGSSWGPASTVCSTELAGDDSYVFLHTAGLAFVGGGPSVLLGANSSATGSQSGFDGLYQSSNASPGGQGVWSSPAAIQPVPAWDDYIVPHIQVTSGCLQDMSGLPAVAYTNNSVVYFSQALDPAGTNWPAAQPVAYARVLGSGPGLSAQSPALALAEINGKPAILIHQYEEAPPSPASLLTNPGMEPRVLSTRLVYASP
jgi:hypothetical protein